jgi:hypothetical protein
VTSVAYQERKLSGSCVRCGQPAADDSVFCERHHQRAKRYARKAVRELRQTRRAAGQCAYCGAKSKLRRCPACKIKEGRIPVGKTRQGVMKGVVNQPGDGLVWRHGTTSRDATTLRYHGRAVRGAPPASVTDEADCKQISAEVERARRGLEYAHSAECAELPRIQRKEARHAALSRLALAKRYIEEVLQRHKYEDSSE